MQIMHLFKTQHKAPYAISDLSSKF